MFKLNQLLPRLVTTTPYPISNGFWSLGPRETQSAMFTSSLRVPIYVCLSQHLRGELCPSWQYLTLPVEGSLPSPRGNVHFHGWHSTFSLYLTVLCSIISKPCLISPPYFPHLLFKFLLLPASSQHLNISVRDYSFFFILYNIFAFEFSPDFLPMQTFLINPPTMLL